MPQIRIDANKIAAVLEANLRKFSVSFDEAEVGYVLEAGDGIARIEGLPGVMLEEMLVFPGEVYGMAMNLERDQIGAIILGDDTGVQQGSMVKRTGNVLQVPVGAPLLGRVVNSLGQPLDGRGRIAPTEYRLVDEDAPGIVDREPVHTPLHTGLKSIDAMTPIGRGQRELIIGDRQTGKTTLVLDTILNQTKGDVRCIYVAIGQKMSTVVTLAERLEERGLLENCVIVAATADESAPLQYIAPFAGCAMGEYYRDRGEHALVIYDDLSKHAVAYRQMSLLLRRPPGREAYPGDIFYLHSRLLERAAQLHGDRGGGSLTALPIIETQQGDYSAYIPTNLISITDGQIYLEPDLFHEGFRPAINVGLSVSRVGSVAQLPAMKAIAPRLRLDFVQYREQATFARLSSELDKTTVDQLHRGERVAEILKQRAHCPLRADHCVLLLWAAASGYLDAVGTDRIGAFEDDWLAFVEHTHPQIGRRILDRNELDEELERELRQAMDTFLALFNTEGSAS